MITDDHWFTEYCEEAGSAHSFRIKARIHEEQTRYQKIEIYETTHFGKLMVIDGFIMLSARADPESVSKGLRLGATKYLTKPVTPDELTKHVRQVLGIEDESTS